LSANLSNGAEGVYRVQPDNALFPSYILKKPVVGSTTYMSKWSLARKAGLPTVFRMYYLDEESVVMPDLVFGGGVVLDKHFLYQLLQVKRTGTLAGVVAKLWPVGVDLPDTNEAEVQFNRIADTATNNSLELPYDNGLAVVSYPNGLWQPLLLDVSFLKINNNRETLHYRNLSRASLMTSLLEDIYGVLGVAG
jgi:hypothetical protein